MLDFWLPMILLFIAATVAAIVTMTIMIRLSTNPARSMCWMLISPLP